mmetsp:Transcript_30993/g.61791  ORF Transcript_30993/g.61791 Transcript_30993/m.61791 type:complete len:106 (+) Transcript_30993:47-364(+)
MHSPHYESSPPLSPLPTPCKWPGPGPQSHGANPSLNQNGPSHIPNTTDKSKKLREESRRIDRMFVMYAKLEAFSPNATFARRLPAAIHREAEFVNFKSKVYRGTT